jgi:UDP-glucose 4-epimerase
MAILINGVAGFIGCNLANKFIQENIKVFGIDNFCRGNYKNIENLLTSNYFHFSDVDISNLIDFKNSIDKFLEIEQITEIWHLAANSDIQAGVNDANIDLVNTFITTFNTLNIMKQYKIKILYFASSSAVYGDFGSTLIHEDIGPLFPISNYGAMKLSSEAIISAASESFIERSYIFRFPNVVGIPATHGIIYDLINKIKNNSFSLDVLGDGTQTKLYLHVEDLIDAMFFIKENSFNRINYFNIGPNDTGVNVKFIAESVIEAYSKHTIIKYGIENKGWIGDVPSFKYNIDKLIHLGWEKGLVLNSKSAIKKAINEIIAQEK